MAGKLPDLLFKENQLLPLRGNTQYLGKHTSYSWDVVDMVPKINASFSARLSCTYTLNNQTSRCQVKIQINTVAASPHFSGSILHQFSLTSALRHKCSELFCYTMNSKFFQPPHFSDHQSPNSLIWELQRIKAFITIPGFIKSNNKGMFHSGPYSNPAKAKRNISTSFNSPCFSKNIIPQNRSNEIQLINELVFSTPQPGLRWQNHLKLPAKSVR